MSDEEIARALVGLVGGATNITAVTACAVRVRFVLRDAGMADEHGGRAVPGVVMVVTQGGQFQVVLGARAVAVLREVRGVMGA